MPDEECETTVVARRDADGSTRFVRVPLDPSIRLERARERAADSIDTAALFTRERAAWGRPARRFET